MSTHNICFYGELMKIILQLSSNTLLICFTEQVAKMNNYYLEEQSSWKAVALEIDYEVWYFKGLILNFLLFLVLWFW